MHLKLLCGFNYFRFVFIAVFNALTIQKCLLSDPLKMNANVHRAEANFGFGGQGKSFAVRQFNQGEELCSDF
jgi:hypothetical protein